MKSNKEIENRVLESQELSNITNEYVAKSAWINEKIEQYAADTLLFRAILLEQISKVCKENKLTLKGFPYVANVRENDLIIQTNQITVEGEFKGILQLIYHIEQTIKLGRVSSVKYYLTRNYNTKEYYLQSDIYLQNFQF